MFVRQVGRDVDGVGHYHVTELPFFLINGESFSFQPYLRVVLGSRFDLEFDFAVHCLDDLFATENGGVQVQRSGDVQVITHPFEPAVFRDVEGDIQIACRSAVYTRSSLSSQFDGLPVGDTGRDGDTQVLTVYGDDLLVCLAASAKETCNSVV